MALSDVFSVQQLYESPSGAASLKMYYGETTAHDGADHGTQILAEAFDVHFGSAFLDLLSDDWWLAGLICRKHAVLPQPQHRLDNTLQVGNRVGPSLPANNCIQIRIRQQVASGKHDGRIYVPGIPEGQTTIGTLNAGFVTIELAALVQKMGNTIAELSAGTGVWSLGVINQTILNAAGPGNPKDWVGAFALSTGVTGMVIIATQRRRQTKVLATAL